MAIQNEAPVLLIIFNRFDTTEKVFEAIRKAKPKKLYISADAPRPGNEKDSVDCEKTRDIVKKSDWECDVHYRFLDQNLGCGLGVSSAISWAFEKEDRLIILEDDCVPSLPFFSFCDNCLEQYKEDSRVWTINGRSHHQNHPVFKSYDYVFSRYAHCWGWATWKRVWKYFDIAMEMWPEFRSTGGFSNCLFSAEESSYYNKLYDKLYRDAQLKIHSWAYPFNFNLMSNGALAITPSKNLIQNIGLYGVHSNGTKTKTHSLLASNEFFVKNVPTFILPNREYELFHFRNHIHVKEFIIKRIFRRFLRKFGVRK